MRGLRLDVLICTPDGLVCLEGWCPCCGYPITSALRPWPWAVWQDVGAAAMPGGSWPFPPV